MALLSILNGSNEPGNTVVLAFDVVIYTPPIADKSFIFRKLIKLHLITSEFIMGEFIMSE